MSTDTTPPDITEQNFNNPKMIADMHINLCFDRVVGMEGIASPVAAKRYVEQLLEESKKTDDPIESMMIQQIIMAHHRIANLHASAATAKKVDTCEAYSAMAQRLLAEFRRMVLALREYRTPATGKQTTIVHKVEQWNQAEGSQDVSYAKAAGPEGGVQMKAQEIEQVSKDDQEAPNELIEGRERRLEKSEAGCCGTT